MEKIIKNKFDLVTKSINFNKIEETLLWIVFLILPFIILGYPALKYIFK